MNKFEIFIPVASKDLNQFIKISKRIEYFYPNHDLVCCTPDNNYELLKQHISFKWKLFKDSSIINSNELNYLQTRFNHRAGWYIQQILKLRRVIYSTADYLILWDSDTCPYKFINFLDSDGKVKFFLSKESYYPYYKFLNSLNINKYSKYSFITQIMCVPRKHISKEICMLFNSENLMSTLNLVIDKESELSEYEIIGNLCFSISSDSCTLQKSPFAWTRLAQLLENENYINKLLQKYYFFGSFENSYNDSIRKRKYFYLIKERLFGLV